MDFNSISENMYIDGSTEFQILHIPIKARKRFIEIITPSHPKESVEFWKNAWTERDQTVRSLVGEDRQDFILRYCIGNLADALMWGSIWENIDKEKEIFDI
jgi:hypothetical protein